MLYLLYCMCSTVLMPVVYGMVFIVLCCTVCVVLYCVFCYVLLCTVLYVVYRMLFIVRCVVLL